MMFLPLFLVACSSPKAALDTLVDTASGTLHETQEYVDGVVQPLKETFESANNRIKQVQSGVLLIQEGIQRVRGE